MNIYFEILKKFVEHLLMNKLTSKVLLASVKLLSISEIIPVSLLKGPTYNSSYLDRKPPMILKIVAWKPASVRRYIVQSSELEFVNVKEPKNRFRQPL